MQHLASFGDPNIYVICYMWQLYMLQAFVQCVTCEILRWFEDFCNMLNVAYFSGSWTSAMFYMSHLLMVQGLLQCGTCDILRWFKNFCNILHATSFDGSRISTMCYMRHTSLVQIILQCYMWNLSIVGSFVQCATCVFFRWFKDFCNVLHVTSFDGSSVSAMCYMWILR